MAFIYEPYPASDGLTDEQRKRKQANDPNRSKAVFDPYRNNADPERNSYYNELERQYQSYGKQLEDLDPGGFGNWISGGNERIKGTRAEIEQQMSNIQSLMTKSKTAFSALDSQKAPDLSPQMLARLRALEEESKMGPLAQDALFQGDRSTLVRGGQQALSNVANKQLGFGASGGFSNIGSTQDVYDRLGGQLSQLGQQSRAVKEQKRDISSQEYQNFDDAKRNFENAQQNAEAAIISGNLDQAFQFMEAAVQAESKYRNAQADFVAKMSGKVLGGAVEAAGYALGAPPAKAGAGQLGSATEIGQIGGDTYTKFSSGATLPGSPTDYFKASAPVSSMRGR